MVGGLEGALLDRIELDTLDLNLENWRQLADCTKLFRHRITYANFLDVKSTVNGSIDIS